MIRSLEPGGAERQLVALVNRLDKGRFQTTVLTFYDGGAFRGELEKSPGVTVLSLGKQGRWDLAALIWRLPRVVRQLKPDIVHGYLGVANELALLTGKLSGARVVWGLRASLMEFSRYGRLPAILFRVGAWLSPFADLIIVNSAAGKRHHVEMGYASARMRVIPNGIDTVRFRPDGQAGRAMRAAWGLAPETKVIGLVGRVDPMKDHPTFLRAAGILSASLPEVQFVCVGDGPGAYVQELKTLAREWGIERKVHWAGGTGDIVGAYNALNLLALTSVGEGFPNVVGEAMACGVPCVVTDVGDSALIVGDTGAVVPPRDPEATAEAWRQLLARDSYTLRDLGAQARERIMNNFSVDALARNTEAALRLLVEQH